jgi:hypothetical protein
MSNTGNVQDDAVAKSTPKATATTAPKRKPFVPGSCGMQVLARHLEWHEADVPANWKPNN